MRVSGTLAIVLALTLPHAGPARADWPHWRGPNYDGSTETANLPVEWSPTENVAWVVDLPGPSAATPAVAAVRVFVTAFDEETTELLAICLDRATGQERWRRGVGNGRPGPRPGYENSGAECSPVTDGTIVCFMFGNGLLTAFDPDGSRLWQRDLVEDYGSFDIQWGYASSPLLLEGTLYVQVLRSGESYLLAVDPATGETRWRHVPPDDAPAESEQAYTSPIPFDNDGRTEILVLGADSLTGHDPATGRELWRWNELNPNGRGNFRAISSAVASDDGFVYVTVPRGNDLYAVRVRGDVAQAVWSLARPTPDVSTPLIYGDRLYVVDGKRRRRMACVDRATGAPVWEHEIDSPTYIRSSATAADGKIYLMDAEGFVNVLAAGDEFRQLAQVEMDSYPSRASIAIDDGQLLIRAGDRLYCVGTPSPQDDAATSQSASTTQRAGSAASAGPRWPSFRGHRAAGVADGHPLPVQWDVAGGENVRWSTPIPGLAHSSPVVWGDRLFVTTAEKDDEAELTVGLYGSIQPVDDDSVHRFKVYCLDRATGSVLWSQLAHEGVPAVKRHPKGSHAASTPATDGRHVVAFFGSEGLYCYDMSGKLLWKRDFGVLESGYYMVEGAQWGFASSPVIHDGMVLVQCDVIGDSFVAALRIEDGVDIWRTARDEVPTWGSPTVDIREGRSQVIVNGFKHIGGYDLETGAELWKHVGGGDIPVPTPIVGHDLIFIMSAHGMMAPIYAIDPMVSGEILRDDRDHMPWMYRRGGNYMQTPLVYGEHLYGCADQGILSCYNAVTGEQVYKNRIGPGGTGFTASIVAGDGKIYATSEEGEVHVIRAGPGFELLAVNELGETCMASPAIAGGTIYFRTRHDVVAIGAD